MTHAGIDGYSRLITFIKCSTNNTAQTMYNAFLQGIRCYGLPSRIRIDQGRENYMVAHHMIRYRGSDRMSVIAGSSVHNQRIERLWRDLHRCVSGIYYRLFYHLEHCGVLNPVSERDLFALHYVFTPRINESIRTFTESWNHHGLRTAHNSTPLQLYTSGFLRLQNTNSLALDFHADVDEDYGASEEGLPSAGLDDGHVGVVVPETNFVITQEDQERLVNTINPLEASTNYGIDIYERTIAFLA